MSINFLSSAKDSSPWGVLLSRTMALPLQAQGWARNPSSGVVSPRRRSHEQGIFPSISPLFSEGLRWWFLTGSSRITWGLVRNAQAWAPTPVLPSHTLWGWARVCFQQSLQVPLTLTRVRGKPILTEPRSFGPEVRPVLSWTAAALGDC